MNLIRNFIIILLIAAVIACDVDSNCGSIAVNYVTLSSYTTNLNQEESLAEITYDSIISPQTDSVFIKDSTTANLILPLDPGSSQTDFYFYYNEGGDTISFTYGKRTRVDSPECGIDFEFVGLDTIYQTYDSMIIVNDTLRRTINAPNIKFYINQ